MHESLIIIILSGFFSWLYSLKYDNDSITTHIKPDIIFNYILPPIILSAGFNMRKKYFFRNLGYIGLFGFMGTLVMFCLCTVAMRYANMLMDHNEWQSVTKVMTLSVPLVATDTIAPLALIDQKEFPTLFSVIFGEGVFNDAVALLLMNVVAQLGPQGSKGGLTTRHRHGPH